MAASPFRESTRNASIEGVMPSNSWSVTSSTSPLRLSRRESPLISDTVPNHHYHRFPTQLARRQSSSYNHVRNNNLVSRSPFKVNGGFKPSRIPTPSRATVNEDENKPDVGFKRRQSRGFQGLFKEQAVTKSPFLGDKRTSVDIPPPTLIPVPSHPRTPSSHLPPSPESTGSLSSTPPPPSTPRNSRVADFSRLSSSPSPKPSLVSTKRLHGPRSLSASPCSENGRRQRRKTVTFDERCDVLEFDQDEVSEDVIETDIEDEDVYSLPEPPSPGISASTNGSFASDSSEKMVPTPPSTEGELCSSPITEERVADHVLEQSNRMPRISRDDIRRRLLEQRGEVEVENLRTSQHTPDASFDVSYQSLDVDALLREQASPNHPSDYTHTPEKGVDVPFNFNEPGIELGDIHSALDRLMLGVEHGFGLDLGEGESAENEISDGGVITRAKSDVILSDVSKTVCDVENPQYWSEKCVEAGATDAPEVLSADEDVDEPITPPLIDRSGNEPPIPEDANMAHGTLSLEDSMRETPTLLKSDESVSLASHDDIFSSILAGSPIVDLSTTDIAEEDSLLVRMSTPPPLAHNNQQHRPESLPQRQLQPSLSLPPLCFDPPSPNTSDTVLASLSSSLSTATGPQLPNAVHDDAFPVRSSSLASNSSIPPPVPPKDRALSQQREEPVNFPRREMQADYEGERQVYRDGRPSKRRSLSTGDAEDLASSKPSAQRRADRLRDDCDMNFLDIPLEQDVEDDALADVIDRELKIRRKPTVKQRNPKYQLRQREDTIYASADDKVSHMSRAGDVDSGKAWRTVRRPSDMNEYSRQIKEYRTQQKSGKAHGKVFVKVLGIKGLNVPLPAEPTSFTCTLNNGIHFVTTPECRLSSDSRIEQEFELIEHSKLEFTLTLKVRRDPHIMTQTKTSTVPVAIVQRPVPSSSRGVRNFFGVGGSPKKVQKIAVAAAARATPEPVEDNFVRYLKSDGTLARAFVSFKEIAGRCDTRLLETSFPLIGQRMDSSTTANPWTVGEIVLQMFRLPPLPGIPPDQLPQSLEECHRGLRHINWHKVTYYEGVLTQNGGDCRTWRRRLLRVIGSNLVAFNDVTKKATATIDLKKAVAVEDDDSPGPVTSPVSSAVAGSRDEFDEVYRVERSFRLIFPNDEEISFFADSDEAKVRWLEVFRALVGHIPPNPLWAELIWQRQEELAKNPGTSASGSAVSQPVASLR